MDYTLADIARVTGAKRRACQLWAEAGAIVAEPESERGGSGVHRKFARTEAMIACVLADFALQKVAIGHLIEIGERLRSALSNNEHNLQLFENAILGIGQTYYLTKSSVSDKGGTGWLAGFITKKEGESKDFHSILGGFDNSGEGALVSVIALNRCLNGMR